MIKLLTLFTLSLNILFGKSLNCYTQQDIFNNGFVSYETKVYDIINYVHPGGQDTLFLSIGKPLEQFFTIPSYKFHTLSSSRTKTDLKNFYIGDLYDFCGNKTSNNTIPYIPQNFQQKDNKISIYNPHIIFLIISFSFIILYTSFIYCFKTSILFNENINLQCFGFISKSNLLFFIFYFIWWISLFIFSFFYKNNLYSLGVWICLNISFTLLPMTRNSIWITIFNIQYNHLIYKHIFIGFLTFISVIIKFIAVLVKYDFNFLFNIFNMLMGTLCTLFIILLSLLSIPIIRRKVFELFYYSHRIFAILIIVSMSLHYINCLFYIIPSLLLYLVDIICRLVYINKSIYTKINNFYFSDLKINYILLTLKIQKKINIKPGSYFFICCRNISKFQWHPITLLSNENNILSFCIKDMGKKSWSGKLKNLKKNIILSNEIEIYLQGPYSHFNLSYKNNSYKYILNISNGIGVTPFFSILEDINEMYLEKQLSKLKKVIFIWIVPNELFIEPFINRLENLNKNIIDIQIFITKPTTIHDINENYYQLLNIMNCRPNITNYVEKFIIDNTVEKNDMCILSCGSDSLTNDIYKASSKFHIEVFNENF